MSESVDLQRFVDAQRDTYARALQEVRDGAKRSHWMWYIFPQIAGLGHSVMAARFAITGMDEAVAYLAHPVLGTRLREITGVLQRLPGVSAEPIFGDIDATKLRSSLTLFARAESSEKNVFRDALGRWFGGEEDPATVARL